MRSEGVSLGLPSRSITAGVGDAPGRLESMRIRRGHA